jgi:hypothetical protein
MSSRVSDGNGATKKRVGYRGGALAPAARPFARPRQDDHEVVRDLGNVYPRPQKFNILFAMARRPGRAPVEPIR